MRIMSFFLTTRQFRERTKTVTRRLGWKNLKPGEIVMGVVKCQGLGKGGKVERLGPIRIVDVRQERLDSITPEDVIKEGFHHMQPFQFVNLFMQTHESVTPETTITRIEFEYVEDDTLRPINAYMRGG